MDHVGGYFLGIDFSDRSKKCFKARLAKLGERKRMALGPIQRTGQFLSHF